MTTDKNYNPFKNERQGGDQTTGEQEYTGPVYPLPQVTIKSDQITPTDNQNPTGHDTIYPSIESSTKLQDNSSDKKEDNSRKLLTPTAPVVGNYPKSNDRVKIIKKLLTLVGGVAVAAISYSKLFTANNSSVFVKLAQIGFSIGLGIIGGISGFGIMANARFDKFCYHAPKILPVIGGAIGYASKYENNFASKAINTILGAAGGYAAGILAERFLLTKQQKSFLAKK